MGWIQDHGVDVTAAFQGITTPLRELYDEVHQRGWDVQKVDVKDGQYVATVKNPHGETLEKVGPDPQTAIGHCLVGIMRQETMRYPRTAAWEHTWEDKLPQIAKAYADAPAYDPKAASAWKELAEDSERRAQAIANQINVEYTDDPYPYENVNEMAKDIQDKQHVMVSKAGLSHPLWSTDQALAYRLVHDVLGHASVGGDWGWHGENGATAAHMPLLSPEAQRALFTEAIGQSAHNNVYRQLGPQKIAFLDDHLEEAQDAENAAGHGGTHPSQTVVPTGIPSIEPEEKTSAAALDKLDPNDGWTSGIEPLPDNAYLWQKEEDGSDPLDYQGGKDQAHKINSNWSQLQDHNGYPDLDSQRQAVVNAFRSTLLSPRQTPRWAATHYQHIQHVPATVSDPSRFADALNVQRAAHNKARGLPEGIHKSEWLPQEEALRQWVKGMNPQFDDAEVDKVVKSELFHMIAEEEERVTGDDPGGQLLPMQINDAVNKALRKRLTVATKPRVDQKFDFGRDRLFHEAFQAPDPGVYGDFLHSHLRPIAGVGLHANRITRAARDDVAEHGGKGHHFRAQVSDLIPGVGPRQISHAWYMLQPHTSQLAIIQPSIAETLGHPRDKEVSPRDYFKLERQMAAGRDAAGYTHVPLGQFSSNLYDNANYGHGVHRDLSPFAVQNPTPHDQVDWTQYPNLPTSQFADPYWWKSTQPNRDQVGKDWDQMVAVNNPAEQIPYRTAAAPYDYAGPDLTNGTWQLPPSARGVLTTPYITHPQSGEVIEGDPNHSLMQHAKNTLGMGTEEIWAMDPEVGRLNGQEDSSGRPINGGAQQAQSR